MKRYGQFCPVAKAAEIFCERWTALIIRDLATGAERFAQLQRGVPLMSPTLLSRRLRQLEAEHVVERRPATDGRGSTYRLTAAGREFVPLIEGLGAWGQRWTRRDLVEGEVDLGLLIWALERSVRGDAFGSRRHVVQLELTDQTAGRRRWWFVHERGGTQLCLDDPGYEIHVYLSATLPDMIRIVRGDLGIDDAIAQTRLEVSAAVDDRRRVATWLNLSPLAAMATRREPTTRVPGPRR